MNLRETTNNGDFTVKRLLAIGDIHGCLDHLCRLLDSVEPQAGDQFVFLGDYIDRGPDSVGVIDYLLDFRQKYPAVFLCGNHEQLMLDYLAGKDQSWLDYNIGGEITLNQYNNSSYAGLPEPHLDFIKSLEFAWTWGNFIFVHAGLKPGLPLNQQSADDLLWIRGPFIDSPYDWGKTVVFGHTPQNEPLLTKNRIGIDTDAVRGGQLTCCDVLTRQLWSV
jgi:serine/threonine protein phosphatase 1